jgi:glycosyltransferase involved in cell wall biosynthesis
VPEIILDGETGLLVPVRDAGALSAAMRTLVDSPILRHRMGAAARQVIEEVASPAHYMSRLTDILTEAAERKVS